MSEVMALIAEIKSKGLLNAGNKLEELYAVAARIETDYAELKAQRDALAAENAALKSVFTTEEVPECVVDAFNETAIMDHDWNDTGEWSWVENDTDVIRAVLEAIKPETPATDAYLNSVRADAVQALWDDSLNDVGHVLEEIGAYQDASEAGGIVHSEIQERVDDFVAQLRAGEPS